MFTPLLRNNERCVVYFPAVSINTQDLLGNLSFCNSNALIQRYPYLLLSYGMFQREPTVRDSYALSKDITIFGDSGGYQLVKNSSISKDKSLEWCTDNTDLFAVLDKPLVKMSMFNECLALTAASAEYCAKNKPEDRLVLNVVSGTNTKVLPLWYQEVVRPYQDTLDGICHGQNGRDLKTIFKFFFYSLREGALGEVNSDRTRYYHVFGVGTNTVALYLMFLQRLINESGWNIQVSYDTSTPFVSIYRYGKMLLTDALKGFKQYAIVKHYDNNAKTFSDLPDDDLLAVFRQYPNQDWKFLISQHNLKKILEWKRHYEFFIQSPLDIAKKELKRLDSVCLENVKVLENCLSDPKKALGLLEKDFVHSKSFEYKYNDLMLAVHEADDFRCDFSVPLTKFLTQSFQVKAMEHYEVKILNFESSLIPGELFV